MEPAKILFAMTASLLMLSGPQLARGAESTVTFDWMGSEVAIVASDNRAYGQPFDISFSIDMSTLPPGDTFAFKTYLYASDDIDISGVTWTYTFISDEPVWNLSLTGVLGDVTTPTTYDGSGYSIRLYDLINGEYTWLFSDYNDKVVWTLHDVVLLADADFDLTLEYFLMLPVTFGTRVTPTPEPSTATLLCLGLGGLAAARRKSLRNERRPS
jgi:hypothetical protein